MKKKKTKVAAKPKRVRKRPERLRCRRCGLAVVKSPYGRWKHVGNRQTGTSCGQEPDVAEAEAPAASAPGRVA